MSISIHFSSCSSMALTFPGGLIQPTGGSQLGMGISTKYVSQTHCTKTHSPQRNIDLLGVEGYRVIEGPMPTTTVCTNALDSLLMSNTTLSGLSGDFLIKNDALQYSLKHILDKKSPWKKLGVINSHLRMVSQQTGGAHSIWPL